MEEKVLSGIGGIGLYGIVSVCLFFAFFTGVTIWAMSLRKNYIRSMRDLPLDGGEREEDSNSK